MSIIRWQLLVQFLTMVQLLTYLQAKPNILLHQNQEYRANNLRRKVNYHGTDNRCRPVTKHKVMIVWKNGCPYIKSLTTWLTPISFFLCCFDKCVRWQYTLYESMVLFYTCLFLKWIFFPANSKPHELPDTPTTPIKMYSQYKGWEKRRPVTDNLFLICQTGTCTNAKALGHLVWPGARSGHSRRPRKTRHTCSTPPKASKRHFNEESAFREHGLCPLSMPKMRIVPGESLSGNFKIYCGVLLKNEL